MVSPVSTERETETASSRAEGAAKHRPSINPRACSSLLNCSVLRGKAKPRSVATIGVSEVEGPRRGSSNYLGIRASHNRRPLSTAFPRKGSLFWSFMFVAACAATPPVAESSTSAPTATVAKFAVARGVAITTGGSNAVRPTVVTRAHSKADWLIASVREPTADVSFWLEAIARCRK